MMVLFTLPADIWREKILVFLMLKNIARAFTAFSANEIQEQFRALTDGHTLQSPMSLNNKQMKMVKWCLSRVIFPGNLSISETLDPKFDSLLPSICVRASTVSFSFSERIAEPMNCARLQSLELYRCNVSDLSNLLELSNLTNLSVSDCPELTTDALIESVARCKQIKTCAIKYCALIEERAAVFIINECRHLEGLSILQDFDLLTVLEARERTAPEHCAS